METILVHVVAVAAGMVAGVVSAALSCAGVFYGVNYAVKYLGAPQALGQVGWVLWLFAIPIFGIAGLIGGYLLTVSRLL